MMIYSALQAGQTDMASELIGNYLKKEGESYEQKMDIKSNRLD